ncbi:MAG: zinc ribbon domain-containing protein [Lachnospiraceae bacterium]|nr:zinc ribbon domain-containing protein [Lachnospiraceae bacterium]
MGTIVGIIIILVLILIIFACIAVAVFRVKRKVQSFSREVFGTEDIVEGFKQVEQEYAATPKSVSAMTSLYLPKIKRDFPEFQYDEMKVRAENALTSYLLAIDGMNVGLLKEDGQELKDKLEMRISMLKGSGKREHFKNIKLHRTEISDYRKRNGRCIVTFQSSVQYYYTMETEDGRLLEGRRDFLKQSRYNTDVIYIQDRSLVEEERDFSLGINCPNCGAPISGLGSKVCEYCGTPVIELNIYAWTFSNIAEVE